MKFFEAFVLVLLAAATCTHGKAVYDEKSEAIKIITDMLKEVDTYKKGILTAIETEKKNINPTGETDLIKQLGIKANETKTGVEEDARGFIRTAIVKAKPVSVILCIKNVLMVGSDEIDSMVVVQTKYIQNIKVNKIAKLNFDQYAVNAILTGLTELIEQAKSKINSNTGVIQNIKNEAIKHAESANLLLGDIEVNIHEPNLSSEYVKARQNIDRKLREMREHFNTNLEKCLNATKQSYY